LVRKQASPTGRLERVTQEIYLTWGVRHDCNCLNFSEEGVEKEEERRLGIPLWGELNLTQPAIQEGEWGGRTSAGFGKEKNKGEKRTPPKLLMVLWSGSEER